ncbi:MAG: hypothetical protein LBI79_10250 [Nitrososphaerota archaeon]|nr:hypothetical protein [Nitrososphaerota archaeon]
MRLQHDDEAHWNRLGNCVSITKPSTAQKGMGVLKRNAENIAVVGTAQILKNSKIKATTLMGKSGTLNITIVEHSTIEIIIKQIDFLTKRYSFLPHNLST